MHTRSYGQSFSSSTNIESSTPSPEGKLHDLAKAEEYRSGVDQVYSAVQKRGNEEDRQISPLERMDDNYSQNFSREAITEEDRFMVDQVYFAVQQRRSMQGREDGQGRPLKKLSDFIQDAIERVKLLTPSE